MIKKIFRLLAHIVFGIRRYNDHSIKSYAKDIRNQHILEIGSGQDQYGKDYYSAKKFFDSSNQFIQSDIQSEFGHKIVDITKMNEEEKYDVILCMNVLEHVYDFQLGIDNMHRALREKGQLVVFVPFLYPLHDEPSDYWRFTEHSLLKMFSEFRDINIDYSGLRQLPVAYFLVATK